MHRSLRRFALPMSVIAATGLGLAMVVPGLGPGRPPPTRRLLTRR